VHNATLDALGPNWAAVTGNLTPTLYVTRGGTLKISGTNAMVKACYGMVLEVGATLHFAFDKTAPAVQPIIDFTDTSQGRKFNADASSILKIDARKLAQTGGAKDIFLVRATSNSETEFNRIIANLDDPDGICHLHVEDGGKELRLDVDNLGGTVILLR